MVDLTPEKKLMYTNFNQAQQTLSDILPVDYFLANEVCNSLFFENQLTSETLQNLNLNLNQAQVQAIVFHLVLALSHAVQQGNTCLPLDQIANTTFGFSSDEVGNVQTQGYLFAKLPILTQLLAKLPISPSENNLLVYTQQTLYLRRYYQFEHELSQQISSRLQTNNEFSLANIKTVIGQLFPATAHETAATAEIDWQKVSVVNALNKNFTVIAGGPGTGKTYTVTKLLAALVSLHQLNNTDTNTENKTLNYALVAPTGKAAQRLSESIKNAINQFKGVIDDNVLAAIPTSALTIHRLLGYIPHSPNFRHDQNKLLSVDFLLIDEASMVDLALLTRVFRALPVHTKIVLLGDADQLPSVAVGNVLADITPKPHPGYSVENSRYLTNILGNSFIKGKKTTADHLTFLLKSRRFDGEGGIGKLAKAVIAGQSELSWNLLSNTAATQINDLTLLKPVRVEKQYKHHSTQYQYLIPFIEQYYLPLFNSKSVDQAFNLLNQFRILSATRQGVEGVEEINRFVTNYFIRQGYLQPQQSIYHAMPILVTENNHKLGIYNGDVGIIWQNEAGHLMAMFENTELNTAEQDGSPMLFKQIIPSRLPKFEAVYAMTIHKSQGSEFEHVLLVNPSKGEHKLLSRELIYTGITRAKKQLTIQSFENVWRQAVDNQVKRFSTLTIL